MKLETFRQALGVLKRSRIGQLRLLGGEPTLHPQFSTFVEEGRAANFNVLIFSNGLICENALKTIERHRQEDVALLVNVNRPTQETRAETDWQTRTLARLGPRVGLGHTICHSNADPSFLIDLVEKHGLRRQIRLGLAHPCLGFENSHLHPKHYKRAGATIARFMVEAERKNIAVDLDCGFVPCMFPPGFLEERHAPGRIGNRCNPMPDLLADGTWIPCYPLAQTWQLPLLKQEDTRSAQDAFVRSAAPYRKLGIYSECADCDMRDSGQCAGGCLSAAMRRLRPAWKSLPMPSPREQGSWSAAEPKSRGSEVPLAQWHIPYIDQPISFWADLHEDFGRHIQCVYLPLPGAPDIGSGRPPQAVNHLESFLRNGPFRISILINPITLPAPAETLAPRILGALEELCDQFQVRDVTVSNLHIARCIRERFPGIRLTASVLMDIATPHQALAWADVFDVIVPSNRIMRQRAPLQEIKAAFPGRVRLIVNEACVPGCPFRTQHFQEMAGGLLHPQSLCEPMLNEKPWLRLTGAWVLPQHLHLYTGLYDELKLAGRVTLQDPNRYQKVLGAYVRRQALQAHEIGGGPASVLEAREVSETFYAQTMECGMKCHTCSLCRTYNAQPGNHHEIDQGASIRPGSEAQSSGALPKPGVPNRLDL